MKVTLENGDILEVTGETYEVLDLSKLSRTEAIAIFGEPVAAELLKPRAVPEEIENFEVQIFDGEKFV